MRCGCPNCDSYMINAEKGLDSLCKCIECGHECRDCLGDKDRFPQKIEKGGKIPIDILRRLGEQP